MTKPKIFLPISLLLGAMAAACSAAPADEDVRAEIAKRLEISVEAVRPSEVPGLYEVASGAEVGYVSTDVRFYFNGDIFDMESRENLTDRRRREARLALVTAQQDDDAIVFGPADARHTITIFTDIDCGYCRKLHGEIAQLNELGIRVRYLMFPRSGPGGDSWKKAESVWCNADRADALTRAKLGETVEPRSCDNPVQAQNDLGREMGIRGTPGIITDSGDLIAGYLPAPRLSAELDRLAATGK